MGLRDFPPNSDMHESNLSHERTPLIADRTQIDYSKPQEGKRIWHLICIVLSVLLERTAYYGILANLVLFLSDDLEFRLDITIACLFLFTGMSWLMSTIGGLIGDSYLGRFHTIWCSLAVYIIGAILLDFIAYGCNVKCGCQMRYVAIALSCLLLSIGEGAFKANSSAFGAEQLLTHAPDTYTRFFNWFYWAINIGSFIGYSLIAWVQVNYSFIRGFLIPVVCLVASLVIFLIPTASYTVYPLSGNALRKVFGIVKEAYSLRKSNKRSHCPGLEEVMPINSWLDRAMCKYGGSHLDSEVMEVKTLGKISVLFVMLIPYWMVYYQMNSTFLFQGLHMRLEFNQSNSDSTRFDVPAAWLTLVDVAVIIMLIPLMDKVVYVWLERRGCQMSPSKRISIGFLFAIASMFTAGIVELQRMKAIKSNPTVNQTINHQVYGAANMTIFYQVPQYGLIGISEVFASVGCLEFAYREAPESMHGFVMGLFYLVGSLGNLIGAGLYLLCAQVLHWTTIKYNKGDADLGRLDYYFYLLGSILFGFWLIFLVVSVRYHYKSDKGTSKSRTSRTSANESVSNTTNQHTL